MDELVRSNKLQFEKSPLFIQIYKQERGVEYIKIIQNIENDSKHSILINPNNLDRIINTLIAFREEISLNQKIENTSAIKKQDEQNIIHTFLKDVTIKDLNLKFGDSENVIRNLLIKNDIVIIDGIGNEKPRWRYKKN
jgi:hypothetical protein